MQVNPKIAELSVSLKIFDKFLRQFDFNSPQDWVAYSQLRDKMLSKMKPLDTKLSEHNDGKRFHNQLFNVTTGKTFENVKEAADHYNSTSGNIWSAAIGNSKTACNCVWELIEY